MKETLRKHVEVIADENGETVLVTISKLQAAAATLDDETTLDALCELKRDFI